MATTVFPLTDQIATVALFTALKNAANRGDNDPVTSISSSNSGDRGFYIGSPESVSADDDIYWREVVTFSVPLGQVHYVQLSIPIDEGDSAAPFAGDGLNFRVTVDSGVTFLYVPWLITDPQDGGNYYSPLYRRSGTVQENALFQRSAASIVDNDPMLIDGLIIGDTAAGNVKIEIKKFTDSTTNIYNAIPGGFVIGRRIW